MAKRLQEAEKMIEDIQNGSPKDRRPSNSTLPDSAEDLSNDILKANLTQKPGREGHPAAAERSEAFNLVDSPASGRMHPLDNEQNQVGSTTTSHTAPKETVPADLSVDEDGKICYYGPTSAVHEPPVGAMQTPESYASSRRLSSATRADIRSSLASFCRESATWEEFALGNASLETGIPRQVMARLLHLHWTWVSPMFGWVYRPAFVSK